MTTEPKLRSSTRSTAPRRRLARNKIITFLKCSSCICTVIGGSLLASKTTYSPYGFLLLASGSSQMVLAGLLMRDRSVICYSGAIFVFVDSLGVYRWLMVD